MSGQPPPADRPALADLLEPALLDDEGVAVDAMRASVRQRLFGAAEEPFRIDRFIVLDRLGAGGMGVVYLAQDPSLGRKVAIKVLHGERARDADAQARLQREARALASLSHPNVVVVHEVGVHEGQLCLVMEHVAGQTLRAWAAAHASDWRAIVDQYRAAGEGLAAAHRAGITHRDFKPENVLVDEDGRPRVVDFGLAAAGAEPGVETSWEEPGDLDLTKTGTILGTPAYMAPEQFLGEPADARTDQFSFCVALWEALFDQRPFAGNDVAGLRRAVLAGRRRKPPSRTRVPRGVVAALARGLAVDPGDRFATMPELLSALAEPRRPGRRAWISVGLAALGGLAAVIVLGNEPSSTEPPAAVAPPSPAPPPPASPMAAASEPPTLVSRRLTQTTGLGVILACVDPQRQHVLYGTSLGELFVLPLSSGARARPIALPLSPTVTGYCGPDGSYWLVGEAAVRRAHADGRVEHILELPHASTGLDTHAGWTSPDGTALALPDASGFGLWSLAEPDAEPVRFELDGRVLGVAWSPDARRIAVTAMSNAEGSARLEVFDADGGLRSSTAFSSIMEGSPAQGVAWLPSGIVVLAFDDAEMWVQCLAATEAGVERGRRSAGLATRPPTGIVDALSDDALLIRWSDASSHLLAFDLSTTAARVMGPPAQIRRGKAGAVWRSEQELAFLAAQPPGALVEAEVDALEHPELLAPGPFDWATGDGDGGVVLGSSDGTTILRLPRGATTPHEVQLPGIVAGDPSMRCRSPRDCLLVSSAEPAVFFGVDLERGHVRRRFACPDRHRCEKGRWAWSHDGEEVLLVHDQYDRLSRFHAETGQGRGEPSPSPPWAILQSVTETSQGERLLTGMLRAEGTPPDGDFLADYRLLRLADDGTYQSLWKSDQTWLIRPVASPSGRRVAVEGLAMHADLVALELGSLCEAPP